MAQRIDILFAECDYDHMRAHTDTYLSILPHDKCGKKRAKRDLKNPCPLQQGAGDANVSVIFTRRAFASCFQN